LFKFNATQVADVSLVSMGTFHTNQEICDIYRKIIDISYRQLVLMPMEFNCWVLFLVKFKMLAYIAMRFGKKCR
jgi:hypothetical protein